MRKIYPSLIILLFVIVIGMSQTIAAQTFVHPGIPFTAYDLAQLKANKNNAPWSVGYAALAADSKSQLSYGMRGPFATVSRAPNLNNTAWISDMQAIHNLTFMWVFTGDTAYAGKATRILDAWAVTNTTWGGGENMLDIGDQVSYLLPAADILKSMFSGWTAANTTHVNNYFANLLYPTSWVPNPLRDNNKGALQLKIAISIAAFLDDATKFKQAIECYRMDAGGGLRCSLSNGEVGDAGRDDHWSVQIEALGWSAEVAWKQGVDMFAELGNQMLAIGELYNHYSLHPTDLTFVPFGGYAAYWTNWGITPGYNHNGNPLNNIIHAAYSLRKGISTPYTDEMLAKSNPSGLSFLYLKTSDPSTATVQTPILYPGDLTQPVTYFSNIDIGNAGLAGTASYNSGTWTAQGAGNSPANAVNYTFKPIKGDVGMIVRVEGNSISSATSGLMIRESLLSTSNYVSVNLNNSGVSVSAQGQTAQSSYTHPQPALPWWLKIERVGNRLFTYHSQDGVNWTNNALFITTLPTDAYIGFYTVSNNTSVLNTATFNHVALNNTFPSGSPEINSATLATATIGAAFNFTVAANGNPTTYFATGLPSGLSLDATTGIISGTPTNLGQSVVTLSATNASGTGTATLIINVINSVAPAAPASLTASVVNSSNISLTWTASANATSYKVKRSLTSGGPYTTVQSGIISTTFIDFSPVYEVNNYYVVTALTGTQESGVSNEVFASVPPAIPSNLKATSKSGEIDLSWDLAAGASTYRVSRGTTSGGPYTSLTIVLTNSYSDIAVTDGNPYYYVVSSLGSTKESANSAEVFGVPGSTSSSWSSTPTDSTWNLAANWVEGNVPVSSAIITFKSSADTVLTNNMTAGLQVSRIQFNAGANAYKIGGNSIVLKNDLVNNSSMAQTLSIPLVLTSQLNVNSNTSDVTLSGTISGTGGLLKTGKSKLYMSGANIYSGNDTLSATTAYQWPPISAVVISGRGTGTSGSPTSGPLGTGKIVMKGGSLYPSAGAATLYNDIEMVAGTSSNIYQTTDTLTLKGRLFGSGTLIDDGNVYAGLNLYGDNSNFSGTFVTKLRSGNLRCRFMVPQAGSINATWLLDANGSDCNSINFSSGTLNFGALSGRGLIRNDAVGNVTISIGALGTNTTYSGTMSGASSSCIINVEKVGTGTLIFSGNQNYGGYTTVKNGTFLINNSSTSGVFVSPITASGGVFGGTGLCSSTVTIGTGSGSGASFVPGTDGTIGKFTTTALVTLNSDATYKADINSNTGTSDTIVANGITITNAVLSIADLGSGTPTLGTKYMIVKNTSASAVTGTFKNLTEFSIVTIGGYDFRITYLAGDGNDIVLIDDRTVTKAVPVAPANLLATATSSSSVGIKWSKSPVSDYVTSYTIKQSATDGGPYTVLASNLKDTTYQDKNLIYNTIYYYAVSATNYLGEGVNSVQDSAKTPFPPIPAVPGGLILAAGDTKASLSWNIATEATSYTIKRASVSGGPYTAIASGVTANTYNDNTVVNGTAYYYVVSSINVTGESSNSAEVSGTPATGGYSYWPCNENIGATATEVWGARNATLNGAGATWVTGISGSGIHCDGTSTGYATIPAGVVSTLSSDFTLSAWVKFDALQSNQRILDFGTSSTNYMFISQNTATSIRYAIKVGSGAEQGITSSTLPLASGKWVHVAVTLSGSTHTLYINGLAVGTSTGITFRPSGLGSTTLNYFGKSQFTADPYLKGTLDDIRIYSRALSSSEVTSILNATAPDVITTLSGASVANQPVLTWTASSEAESYTIRRATVAAGPYTVIATNVIATTYIDATSSLYGTYYYIVTPVSGAFEGAPSSIVSVTLLPAIPANVIATGWNGRMDLSWGAASGATSYDVKRATSSSGPYTSIANVATSAYSNTGLINGTPYYYVISSVNAAGSSANSSEVNATPVANSVADVWSHTDIGAVGISGNAGYSNGIYSLYGAGTNIWTQADAFHFVYQPIIGNGAIVARVLTQDNTNTSAKAGVMIRDSLTIVNSRIAVADHTPGNAVEFIYRTATNTNAASGSTSSLTNPRWVRLVRSGTSFTAYQSADGFTWTQVGTTQTVTMLGTNYFGIVDCSLSTTALNKSTFDHVNIATAVPVITGPTTATGQVGLPFTTTIVATNTPYLYSATGLPEGLTLNADNGMISGTPSVKSSPTITLGAVNAMGAATTITLELNISIGDQSITFNSISDKKLSDADFDPAASASSGFAVTYSTSNPSVATIVNGKIHFVGVGSCTIYADQTGNANYNPAPQVSQTLTVNKGDQFITFNAIASKTYGDADFDLAANASSGLAVTYSSSDATVATIINGKVHILGAGTCSIYADQTGNANYNAAPQICQTLVVNKLNQSITFNAIVAKTFGDVDFDPAATASSNLAVVYSTSDASIATVVYGKVHIIGAGSCTVYANQTGDANYNAALQFSQALVVNKAVQSITFNTIAAKKIGDADFDPAAIATSTLAVAYSSSDASVATIVDSKVHITGAGSCTIYADQAGEANYNAASQVSQLLVVNKLDQYITFDAIADKKVNDADFSPGATSTSGLAITYSSSDASVATIVNGKVHIVCSGSCTIYANQAGNATYNAAPQSGQTLIVTKLDQTITFNALDTKKTGDVDFDPGALASSGLAVVYSSSNITVATIVNGKIHIVGAGSCLIYADQAGDAYYNAAPQSSQSLIVTHGTEIIDIEGINIEVYPNPFTNHLIITFVQEFNKVAEVELVNDKGQKVLFEKVSGNRCVLNVKNIPSGVYFLMIRCNNRITIKKVIKE